MADIGGINVNINVNIAETITGLKAIQREAKKATQALRELEKAQGIDNRSFHVNERILWDGVEHTVLASFGDIAILALVHRSTDEQGTYSTDLTNMFAVSNSPELFGTIAEHVVRLGGAK